MHGTLRDGVRGVDDPVVVISGEGTVADLSIHGGPWVVRTVMDLMGRRGFEVLDTGRVHKEAIDGDSEIAREVAQYLPLATTELGLRALLAQETAWQNAALGGGDGEAGRVLADRSLQWLLHPPRVAVVGIPNVGKSTLANQLLGRERLITADVPGTTRDWVGEIANLDGLPVMLIDTPGVRPTDDPIEREAIERSREQVAGADLVVLVLDPTQPWAGQESLQVEYTQALRIVNKSDQGNVPHAAEAVKTVATTGEGVDRLRQAIRVHFLGSGPLDPTRRRWWTERQRALLVREMKSP